MKCGVRSVQRKAKKRISGGIDRQMKQKIFNRTGRATALLVAAIIAMTGCDYSLSGNESSGTVQADESAAESEKKQESAGKQAAGIADASIAIAARPAASFLVIFLFMIDQFPLSKVIYDMFADGASADHCDSHQKVLSDLW